MNQSPTQTNKFWNGHETYKKVIIAENTTI